MHTTTLQYAFSCSVAPQVKSYLHSACLINNTIYTTLKFTKWFVSRSGKAHICLSILTECFQLHSACQILALPTPGHDPKTTKGFRTVLKDCILHYPEKKFSMAQARDTCPKKSFKESSAGQITAVLECQLQEPRNCGDINDYCLLVRRQNI